jgi:hypothetical protein
MAIAHDERLASIYSELGVEHEFLLDHRDPGLADKIIPTFDRLAARAPSLEHVLRRTHDEYFVPTCAQNKERLKLWARGEAERTDAGVPLAARRTGTAAPSVPSGDPSNRGNTSSPAVPIAR